MECPDRCGGVGVAGGLSGQVWGCGRGQWAIWTGVGVWETLETVAAGRDLSCTAHSRNQSCFRVQFLLLNREKADGMWDEAVRKVLAPVRLGASVCGLCACVRVCMCPCVCMCSCVHVCLYMWMCV